MASVAPYGGFLVKTLDDEKARDEELKQQQVEVQVNGTTETLRPEALVIRGVDNLSTDDIKYFIDYYLNFVEVAGEDGPKYEPKPVTEQIEFRIQWINDTSVSIVFQSHPQCKQALEALSILAGPQAAEVAADFSEQYVASIIQERETKPYGPAKEFRQKQSLLSRLDSAAPADEMDQDQSAVVLYTRQAFQLDRKVKNAKLYLRYYLLHGEPERQRRPRRERVEREPQPVVEDEDLFADRLRSTEPEGRRNRRDRNRHQGNTRNRSRSPGEDLFAHKLRDRERSPMRD